jgi:hypothetical protein
VLGVRRVVDIERDGVDLGEGRVDRLRVGGLRAEGPGIGQVGTDVHSRVLEDLGLVGLGVDKTDIIFTIEKVDNRDIVSRILVGHIDVTPVQQVGGRVEAPEGRELQAPHRAHQQAETHRDERHPRPPQTLITHFGDRCHAAIMREAGFAVMTES